MSAKRGLVLAGGGSRGSHQAGMLQYMGEISHILWPGGFDFISGTSVGNINGAGLAMFPPQKFKEATEYVVSMWSGHVKKTEDIWVLRKLFGVIPGVPALWNPSVGTTEPLQELMEKLVDLQAIQDSGVEFRMSSVDMVTGELVVHTNKDLMEHGVKPIMASSSFPLAMPPVEIGDRWLSDGGLRDTAPVGAAIKAGCDEIVVVTTRDPYTMDSKPREEMSNVFTFGLRCLSIMFHEGVQSDVKIAEVYNKIGRLPEVLKGHGVEDHVIEQIINDLGEKRVVKLTVLYPREMQGASLDFSEEAMQKQVQTGYDDAKAQLSPLLEGLLNPSIC